MDLHSNKVVCSIVWTLLSNVHDVHVLLSMCIVEIIVACAVSHPTCLFATFASNLSVAMGKCFRVI